MEWTRVHEIVRWAYNYTREHHHIRPKSIPGTAKGLNKQVMAVLKNSALSYEERGVVASGLITAKVMEAHKVGTHA